MSRVLVVDDAVDLRLLVSALLRAHGHEVVTAADGRGAVACLEAALAAGAPYDVMLLDVQMPEADGWSVLDHVAARAPLHPLRVCLCSVKGREADRVRAAALGAAAFVAKPFELDELLDAVERLGASPGVRQQ